MLTIPEQCGAILLPDTVVFPHGALPLHIFEPRYRQMLEDSLESHCMICVGTLTDVETADPTNCTAPIGTIGLIRASKELEDGRSNLVIHGICRIKFRSWPGGRDYPFASIAPLTSDPLAKDEAPFLISQLRDKVNEALSGFPSDVKIQINELLDRASDEPSVLADAVAQQFVQDPAQRQVLLNESSVGNRFEILFDFFDRIIGH